MSKMEKSLICLFKSIWYLLLTITCRSLLIQNWFPLIDEIDNKYETIGIFFTDFGVIKTTLIIFCVVFFIVSAICFVIKAIYNLWLFFYYQLFYNNKYNKIQVNINEENKITDSYLEFNNGDRVPLYITKIVGNTINEVKETTNTTQHEVQNEEK